jgi:hypothetical protein
VRPRDRNSILLAGFNFLDQCVDFFRCEFTDKLRHPVSAVCDYVAQFVGRTSGSLFRDKRRFCKMPPFGGFPMTLRAVFLVDRVPDHAGGRRRSLSKGCEGRAENKTCQCNAEFHVGLHRLIL